MVVPPPRWCWHLAVATYPRPPASAIMHALLCLTRRAPCRAALSCRCCLLKAASITAQLQELTAPEELPGDGSAAVGLTPAQLAAAVSGCAASLTKTFDAKQGGFGKAPKFPRPSEINCLLRAALMQPGGAAGGAGGDTGNGSKAAASAPSPGLLAGMALFSLQAMARGGMRDQLGGGFHRYR